VNLLDISTISITGTIFMATSRAMLRTRFSLYIQANKIDVVNIEALITILESAFGDPNQVSVAFTELTNVLRAIANSVSTTLSSNPR
jgi:hypothetical protein